MVATWNVRTLAIDGTNGLRHDHRVLSEAASLSISVVGLQETKEKGQTEFRATCYSISDCKSENGGQDGVAIAVKKSICRTSAYTVENVNERLLPMLLPIRVEVSAQSGAINFVAAYAPTDVSANSTKDAF